MSDFAEDLWGKLIDMYKDDEQFCKRCDELYLYMKCDYNKMATEMWTIGCLFF